MHKIVHLFFAARVRRQIAELTGISLCRLRFLLGNIYPDLTLSMCVTPHKLRESFSLLRSYADELYAKPMHIAEFSKKLGIAMHYVCDYFCYAHSEHYQKNLLHHIGYEFSMIGSLSSSSGVPATSESANAEAQYSSAAALTGYVKERVEAHTGKEHSCVQDIAAALEASKAFCLDAVRRWCELSFDSVDVFDWDEAENAVAF